MRLTIRVLILAALMAFALVPLVARAQSYVAVQPGQCVYTLGDNASWAAPTLDDSAWHPWQDFTLTPDAVHVWIRCHVNFDPTSVTDPAVQVFSVNSQHYEVFLDGAYLAGFPFYGFSHTTFEHITLPIKSDTPVKLVAIRATIDRYQAGGAPIGDFAFVLLGERDVLVAARDSNNLTVMTPLFLPTALGIIVAVIGLFLLVQYLIERTRIETLWLALACISMGHRIITPGLDLSWTAIPRWCFELVWVGNENLRSLGELFFFFAVANKRVPRIFYLLPFTLVIFDVGSIGAMILPARLSLPLSLWTQVTCFNWMWTVFALTSLTAPLVAFWPWWKLKGQLRLTFILCTCWGFLDAAYTGQQVIFGRGTWRDSVQIFLMCAVAGLVLWILILTFRKQRSDAIERATLRGELAAASQIQRMLVPDKIEVAPGLDITSAFFPAKDVGGDFYFCRMLPDGGQRILLGDVSGKGVPAALTSALLLGAADRCDHLTPSAVLSEMNQVLRRNAVTGFTTCLCADVAPDGVMTLANAGHLSPYRNGEELAIDNGLPLGIVANAAYPETTILLAPGDSLAFMSDGVIEATNASGELFGFDRTRSLSRESAQHIANAARTFGQEDDITVLKLSLAPAPVIA